MSLSDFVQLLKLTETAAKDVLPNMHHTQAAVIAHGRHPVTSRLGRNGSVCCFASHGVGVRLTMHCVFVPGDL